MRSFVAVVQHGSMSRAARALGYVPSAVTQHIARLERSLGVELLVRRPGSRIAVTAAGRALVEVTEPLLRAQTDFADHLRSITQSEAPSLVLGTYATAMHFLLPGVLAKLAEQHHVLDIRMRELETPEALPLMRSGVLDMLLGYRYLPGDPPGPSDRMAVSLIGREPMLLVAPPGHPLTFEECVAGPWAIGHEPLGDRRLLDSLSGALGVGPRVQYETADPNASLALVASGLAVSFLPATVVAGGKVAGKEVQVVEFPADVVRPAREVLLLTRETFRPPFLPTFIQTLEEQLSEAVAIERR